MALIVSRAILFLILVLAFGIATVFPEQKLPVYILFTLFVVVAIVSNVWLTHQNVKKHIIKFDKRVAYFFGCALRSILHWNRYLWINYYRLL